MQRSDLADVLLVRALEEADPTRWSHDVHVEAMTRAGEPTDEAAWLVRRARFLLGGPAAAYRPLTAIAAVPTRGPLWLFAGAILVGLASNYLGPTAKIHVVFNSIALLILWNLAVYLLLAAEWLHRRFRAHPVETPPLLPPADRNDASPEPAPPRAAGTTVLRRWLLDAWWQTRDRAARRIDDVKDSATVARRFGRLWFAAASPALFALLRRTLHAGAAGLAVGAVAGMYVRGLFFDYSMIWRSTFVHDPAWVLGSLRLLLGPACALLGRLAPTLDDANALMSLEGQSAAPWIHLYAVTALLVVIVPRLALALVEHLRTRWALAHLTLPVTDPYCRARLDEARELQVRQIVDAIDTDVRAACTDLTAAVVRVVCDDLYDRRIVPHLERFREDGGALADLETAIATECEAFRSTLDSQLSDVQHGFELAVGRSLERTIGRQLGLVGGLPTDLVTTISASSAGSTRAVGASVGTSIADVVGLTVSGAVAVVAGVVSGGLGKSLGTAILVSLLGTSGPVGLLVGGLAGLVVGGAGWWFGREVLADSIRDIPLSGAVVRTALWSSRYEQLVVRGRDACAAAVEDLMQRELEPLVPTLTDQLWVVVRRVLGERRAAARDRP